MATPLEEADRPICHRVENPRVFPAATSAGTYRSSFRSLSAMRKEAVVTSTGSETAWRVASDEGDYLEGADMAPPPLGYLLAGMASGFAAEVLTAADARGASVADSSWSWTPSTA